MSEGARMNVTVWMPCGVGKLECRGGNFLKYSEEALEWSGRVSQSVIYSVSLK